MPTKWNEAIRKMYQSGDNDMHDRKLSIIATAIGYHFWYCDNDAQAESTGMDAAKDVMSAIEREIGIEDETT